MIVDNFKILYNYFYNRGYDKPLYFDNCYLVISIIRRYKDQGLKLTPDMMSESKMVYKTLIINKLEDILNYRDYIAELCYKLQARAYITTTPRQFSQFNASLLKGIAEIQCDINSYNDVSGNKLIKYENLVDLCARNTPVLNNPEYYTYLLDIDKNDLTNDDFHKLKQFFADQITQSEIYSSVNGYHMLLPEYDVRKAKDFFDKEFNNIGDNKFIDQKGKGCRALLYFNK